jgi:hypothetical protein
MWGNQLKHGYKQLDEFTHPNLSGASKQNAVKGTLGKSQDKFGNLHFDSPEERDKAVEIINNIFKKYKLSGGVEKTSSITDIQLKLPVLQRLYGAVGITTGYEIGKEMNKKKYAYGGQLSTQDMKANQYANTIQQTQKSVAGMIPGASIVSPIAGTVADFIDKDNQYGVSKDWSSGVRGAIDPSMSLSRAAGDIGSGKFTWNTAADLAFPIVGEILSNKNKRSMMPQPFTPQQQFTNPGYKPTFPGGGIIPNAQPNIELEKNEVLQGPDGSAVQVNAPSHAQGGIDLAAAGGGRVFSDRIINPETGNTFAEDAARLLKQIKNR